MTADNKITLKDLKISPACWQWMAGKTENFKLRKSILSNNFNNYFIDINFLNKSITGTNKLLLESFIYQAIDGINEISYIMLDPGINEIKCKYTNKYELFICDLYDSKTTARLAALQWIWQQEQKKAANVKK